MRWYAGTAKEILDRCAPKWIGGDCVPRDQALAAIKEIADKAWEAAGEHYVLEGKDRITFMKELFPEDKTGH